MRREAGLLLAAALGLLAGCKGSPPPPPAPKAATPPPAAPAPAPAPTQRDAEAERIAAYSREHPWGEQTGTAQLSGAITWAEGEAAPIPVPRRPLVLKGIPGTPTEGLYYKTRADFQGRYAFDRIKGGPFRLSDDAIVTDYHWRLRVDVPDGGTMALDLTPDNSLRVHDDFPPHSN